MHGTNNAIKRTLKRASALAKTLTFSCACGSHARLALLLHQVSSAEAAGGRSIGPLAACRRRRPSPAALPRPPVSVSLTPRSRLYAPRASEPPVRAALACQLSRFQARLVAVVRAVAAIFLATPMLPGKGRWELGAVEACFNSAKRMEPGAKQR